METKICLFLNWENEVLITGTGNERHKNGNGKPLYHYKDSCGWTFQSEK